MSKICKKGYMEMRKWVYLVPLGTVLGRSILHYSLMFGNFSLSKQKMWKQISKIFNFQALQVSSWNISFLCLNLENFISWNIRSFFRVFFLLFKPEKFHCCKYNKLFNLAAKKFHFLKSSVSWNIRKAFLEKI